MGDEVPGVPPTMSNGEIRENFLNLAQAMISQENSVTSQVQSMTTQANREAGPLVAQHASAMGYHLRDFTRINPPIFFFSKAYEDPQDFRSIGFCVLWV